MHGVSEHAWGSARRGPAMGFPRLHGVAIGGLLALALAGCTSGHTHTASVASSALSVIANVVIEGPRAAECSVSIAGSAARPATRRITLDSAGRGDIRMTTDRVLTGAVVRVVTNCGQGDSATEWTLNN